MYNQSSTPDTPLVQAQGPFKKWSECRKALRSLPSNLQQEGRDMFVARINGSAHKLHISFEVLCWLLETKHGAKLRWLEAPMLEVLSGGTDPPKLSSLTGSSEARQWVCQELQDIRTLAHWKQYVSSGRHFWILYAIFRTTPDKQILVEALTAFTNCAERCHNTDNMGKQKRRLIEAGDATWIMKLLKSKIPAKAELSKSFLECLFAINSTATLSETLRSECDTLQVRLKAADHELATQVEASAIAELNTKNLLTKLQDVEQSLEETKKELREEKLHTTRQEGFNVVAKRETINHALSIVRRGIIHRLDNIRGYADREKPNREEILALVGEIENHIAGVEMELYQ